MSPVAGSSVWQWNHAIVSAETYVTDRKYSCDIIKFKRIKFSHAARYLKFVALL